MATRVVTGTIIKASGTPWAGVPVRFRPVDDSYLLSPDASYPVTTVSAITDADGAFSVTLAADLSVEYEVETPDGETFRIIVPSGSATTLETLRAAYDASTPVPLPSLEAAVTAVIEDSTSFADALEALVAAEFAGVAAATTSASGIVELATTAETTTGTDATRVVTPDGLHDMTSLTGAAWFLDEDTLSSDSDTKVPSQQSVKAYVAANLAAAASDTVAGKVELATTAETTTGTDATRAVTPDGLHDMTSLAGAAWMLDEDTMSSDSATKVPSQQSVKAYVDATAGKVVLLCANTAASSAVASTASETAFSVACTVGANTLAAGDVVRITAWGTNDTHSSGTVTLTLKVRWGGLSGTVILNNGAVTLSTSTSYRWQIEMRFIVRSIGGSGSIARMGKTQFDNAGSGAMVSEAQDGSVTTIATNTSNDIAVTVQHGASNAANTATLNGLVVERLRT